MESGNNCSKQKKCMECKSIFTNSSSIMVYQCLSVDVDNIFSFSMQLFPAVTGGFHRVVYSWSWFPGSC